MAQELARERLLLVLMFPTNVRASASVVKDLNTAPLEPLVWAWHSDHVLYTPGIRPFLTAYHFGPFDLAIALCSGWQTTA
eukprot:scaffold7276_cov215-Chaetoceros_neogracile.AAC.1